MKKFLAKVKKFILTINFKGITKGTAIRTVLVFIGAVNYGLSMFGVDPLKINSNDISLCVVVAITIGVFLTAYWKNNSITKAAQEADEKRKALNKEE